ncbi:amidase signature enzyme [Meredithblackwellia eburnea MCA 4105]
MPSVPAQPYSFDFVPKKTALLCIDYQGDFLTDGGFGTVQGGNLAVLREVIPISAQILQAARQAGLTIFHTREGHSPDLSDLPTPKRDRQSKAPNGPKARIGEAGPAGDAMLVRGQPLHDIVQEMKPKLGEIVIDKPGKGAFYDTELHQLLVNRQISHLLIIGVTTECCVLTTLREANDRGFECMVVTDAVAGYVAEFHSSSLKMASYANGLFGYAAPSSALLPVLAECTPPAPPPDHWNGSLDIGTLASQYLAGTLTPESVIEEVYRRINLPDADPAVWLHLFPKEDLIKAAKDLLEKYPDPANRPPLFGIPYSIKDSIDYKGAPTTGACPKYAYVAEEDAPTVEMLRKAGALAIGKVNLDQLATGLVGMRSPYGQPASVFSKDYVSGGSSSGSCVSVASHQVSFSLATDTAGSGRVPASFNNIIGFKPTRGTIDAAGVVPCCLSLDCIAIEALFVGDTVKVWNTLWGINEMAPFAKVARPPWALAPRAVLQPDESFTFAIPGEETDSRKMVCPEFEVLFKQAIARMSEIGGKISPKVDYTVFEDAGRLLYEGSFVAERVSGVQEWYNKHPKPAEGSGEEDALLPEIRAIYDAAATGFTAAEAWTDALKLMEGQRKAALEFKKFQVLMVPTAPLHPTKKAYLAEPLALNHKLGKFTHYGNILDMCGVSVPAGLTSEGMPFAVTILGPSFADGLVLEIAARFEKATGLKPGKQ